MNRSYLPHCAAMLHSLLKIEPGPVVVHAFFEPEVPQELVASLAGMVEGLGGEISVERVDPGLTRELAGYAPPASWLRIFLAELFPELDRILYLDCDLIVTAPLTPLWSVDLEGACLGAVTTVFPSPAWGDAHCAGLGLASPDLHFNSGVLLMNLRELRAGGYAKRLVAFELACERSADPARVGRGYGR